MKSLPICHISTEKGSGIVNFVRTDKLLIFSEVKSFRLYTSIKSKHSASDYIHIVKKRVQRTKLHVRGTCINISFCICTGEMQA